MDLASYISGFVDGEACFCVSFQPSRRHRFGWEVDRVFRSVRTKIERSCSTSFKGLGDAGSYDLTDPIELSNSRFGI